VTDGAGWTLACNLEGQRDKALNLLAETCRECRDNDVTAPADFILWGKLLAPEALGPKCTDHATKHLGFSAIHRIDQYAVFDLRPIRAALRGDES
jgi:hypothetical protein